MHSRLISSDVEEFLWFLVLRLRHINRRRRENENSQRISRRLLSMSIQYHQNFSCVRGLLSNKCYSTFNTSISHILSRIMTREVERAYFVSFIINHHCYRGGKSSTKSAYLTDYKAILIFISAETATSLHKLPRLPTGEEENCSFIVTHENPQKFQMRNEIFKRLLFFFPKLPLLASLPLRFLDFVVKTLFLSRNILMLKTRKNWIIGNRMIVNFFSSCFLFHVFFVRSLREILCCWENKQKNFHCHVSLV